MGKKFNTKVLAIKTLVSVGFFSVLISFAKGGKLLQVFENVDWFYFNLSFLLIPVMFCTSCFKWKILLEARGQKVRFRNLVRIYLIGYFFSNLLPSTVGGDVVRSFYAGKEIGDQTYSAVCVFLERFTGILFLLVLVIFAPLMKPELYAHSSIYIPVLCAVLLLSVIIWVWRVQDPLKLPDLVASLFFTSWRNLNRRLGFSFGMRIEKYANNLYLNLFKKIVLFHEELNLALRTIRHNRWLFFQVFTLTVVFYFLTWVNVYVSFLAFGTRVPFWEMSSLVPTIMFAAHLPVALLGNLGFFESIFVFYFLLISISGAETLAMGLLLRVKMFTLGGIGFLVYIMYRYSRRNELTELEKFAKQKTENRIL